MAQPKSAVNQSPPAVLPRWCQQLQCHPNVALNLGSGSGSGGGGGGGIGIGGGGGDGGVGGV